MRFAAFVAALAAAASAFGAIVVPRLADDSVPASLQPRPQTLIQQKLEDDRCRDRHERFPARFPGT
ncbi:MAG TPA: hypothetical protein VML35_02480 [Gaiellaceae bacterium]|nr:hypothetical protein [Gaiellaceae bacterium]